MAAAALGLASLLLGGDARANGRFPAAGMLIAQPNDPSRLVLRATYGLLFSSDGGASWDWLCERPVGYGGAEDPSVVLTGSGTVLVGTFKGMARSTDKGCTWSHDPHGPASIVDMALRPSAPDRVYALSCLYSKPGDAGSLFRSELLVSDDAGEHWSSRAVLDPTLLLDSIEVAPSDPNRVYISAIRPRGKDSTGAILVSNDDGRHWTERPFGFAPSDRGVFVAAVDPKDASLLYVRTSGPEMNRLAVSTDAGKTSRVIYSDAALQGFALADDGATVYVGAAKGGLARASTKDYRFEKRWAKGVQCLTSIGAGLWACTPTSSGFVVGASVDQGETFAPKLTLAGMRGPLRCAGASAVSECTADWAALRELVGFDAGGAPAALDASDRAAPQPPARAACGCSAPGRRPRGSGEAWLVAGTLLVACLARRRADGADAEVSSELPFRSR